MLFQDCVICECGEFTEGESDALKIEDDGTGDVYPDSPEEAALDFKDVSLKHFCLYHMIYNSFEY